MSSSFGAITSITDYIRRIGTNATNFLLHVYKYSELTFLTVIRMPLCVKNPQLTINQMYSLGLESLPLVSIIGFFLGAATVTQAVYQMSFIVPMRYLGVLVCKGLTTELGPVVTSMVVAGRVATGIAAEIGSMRTSEQLDAMQVLDLDPIRYLIVPKMLACVIMLPVLVVFAELIAFLGSILTVFFSIDMTMYTFLNGLRLFFNATDVFIGVAKTLVFGLIIAITGAYFGFETKGGAEGVGNATTKAVIVSAILILIFDFIMAFLFL